MGAEVKWHAAVCLQLKLTYTCARMVFYPAELNQLGASVQCLNQVVLPSGSCINVQEFVYRILYKCSGISVGRNQILLSLSVSSVFQLLCFCLKV